MKAQHTNAEKAQALSRSTLRMADICILLDCGKERAVREARDFRDWCKENGHHLYGKDVPTELFIEYRHINEARIIKYAKLGF
jgi:hypothetical protein